MNLPSEEDVLEDVSPEWKVRRIKCLTVFVVQLFVLTFDESIVSTLMPNYIQFVTVGSADKSTYAALLMISYGLAAIVFQLILGRNADQTRRVRRLLVLSNSCSVLGNCIYSIPYGIFVLMIGRFIRGIGASASVIVIGEVARSYLPKDLCRAVSMCLTGSILGSLLGPIAANAFKKVDIVTAKLHIRHENALTLLTSGFFLFVLILTLVLTSDLSSDFDLKSNYYELLAHNKRREDEGRVSLTDEDSSVEESIRDETFLLFGRRSSASSQNGISNENSLKISLQLVLNVVTLAVIFASFVLAHSTILLRKYGVMMVRHKANIDSRYNSVLETLSVLTRGATFLVVGSIGEKVGDVSLVYAGFALVIFSGACWLIIETLSTDNSATLSLFVIALAAICISSCGEISLQVLMAKLVPSSIQSFSEAFRLFYVVLGVNVADLFHGAELSVPLVSGTILTGLNVVTIAVINMNYQYLADPQPIIQITSRKYY